jgi:hypothetical protein
VPGFDRLVGLFTLLAVTFFLTFFILQTRIWIVFGGSILTLVVLMTFVFALLKWAAYSFSRKPSDPQKAAPKFPAP